ncbi:MAG: lactoylglutathione lyase [Candidatus Lambdaproteobacteria bacterium RIFOXYD1_FULL_56_27]|uniref:Lactoylglutathione lyase n=1 Tax=Candidatus Lambdaproteobacteria bacterium RIFOXYD2_FULL_56_26 TaxID=1817773 RepID=A0A1F6GR92_9PROT|nr:MAG: lactoylglutathione lyase [Candidatus Lambdaproteobacteria bacterium RIFOXYC1_FULL_56_13]OGH00663.1 MAG: lactoylglutathione lyase [Candidatus Lambdaproteobacteria bacterium RIFOXYD2_FULL_56_26]OGH07830.1 MAG: lactoylglutathione lyase [Candidatus Lambdaproteobacteria bacterium RIFOXYD1_FULL_56_27]
MKMLHTMIRVLDLEKALYFWVELLGFKEVSRREYEQGRFTLVFLQAGPSEAQLELTYNWDQTEPYPTGRFFGHIALEVEDLYGLCQKLMDHKVTINRPPRDGHMAFVKSPDGIPVELLQKGRLPVQEPWASMANIGDW